MLLEASKKAISCCEMAFEKMLPTWHGQGPGDWGWYFLPSFLPKCKR